MRLRSEGLMIALAAGALAGVTAFAQTPPAQQTPPTQQTSPATPSTIAAGAPVPCVTAMPGLSDAQVMLSHIEDILNEARDKPGVLTKKATAGADGTSGGTTIKVGIDRDKFDEIRAEIAQIKSILKK